MTHASSLTRYRSPAVDLWVQEGVINQILVHDGYAGKLLEVIGLGSTIADIEAQIGPWEEDEEDNLVITGLPGVGFEVERCSADGNDPAFCLVPIKALYVFKV